MYKLKLKKGSKGPMVKVLKTWLNGLIDPSPGLKLDDKFDQQTHDAVFKFQSQNGLHPVNGVVDAKTWGAIGHKLGSTAYIVDVVTDLPDWLLNVLKLHPTSLLSFHRDIFFGLYMEEYGGMKPSQLMGLEKLLSFIEDDPDVNDIRWAAYMLATVKLECANTWEPIEEYGCVEGRNPVCTPYKGKDGLMHDRLYGNPVLCPNSKLKPPQPCPAGKKEHHYYGRGYVQLTHKGNYESMSNALCGDDQLVHSPERVMEPKTAYKIMSLGMRKGMFRHDKKGAFTLARFFSGTTCDYYHARNIINGVVHDTAKEIERNARQIEAILKASLANP